MIMCKIIMICNNNNNVNIILCENINNINIM